VSLVNDLLAVTSGWIKWKWATPANN